MRRALFFLAPFLLVAACGDLKNSTPSTGTDGDSGTAGTSSSSSGSSGSDTQPSMTPDNGPGPLGALPTGYCCTDDSQCRYRHCNDTPAGKMCQDDCRGTGLCGRTEAMFTCDAPDMFDFGVCQPPAGFTCLDPNKFVRGTREDGECCDGDTFTDNADECQGGHCISYTINDQPDNPFVCSQYCASTKDCPSGMNCSELNECEPGNTPYTCK